MIETSRSIWGKDMPEPEPIREDSRGNIIAPGSRVAFNRSGSVIIGKVLEVTKNKWSWIPSRFTWHLNYEIQIEAEDGLISKVKNPNSFVVI